MNIGIIEVVSQLKSVDYYSPLPVINFKMRGVVTRLLAGGYSCSFVQFGDVFALTGVGFETFVVNRLDPFCCQNGVGLHFYPFQLFRRVEWTLHLVEAGLGFMAQSGVVELGGFEVGS